MDKKKLRLAASRIKKANRAVRNAIFAIGELSKTKLGIDLKDEYVNNNLAPLLKNFYDDEGFEDLGFYASDFQEFAELMKSLEETIDNIRIEKPLVTEA